MSFPLSRILVVIGGSRVDGKHGFCPRNIYCILSSVVAYNGHAGPGMIIFLSALMPFRDLDIGYQRPTNTYPVAHSHKRHIQMS